jgi:hypothetical protein
VSRQDKLKTGTREQVLDKLAEIARRLSELDGAIGRLKPSDERHAVLRSIVRFAADQLHSLQVLYTFATEFRAWVARNLYETLLWCRYVLASDESLTSFTTGVQWDEIEMLEGLASVAPEEERSFGRRAQQIRRSLAKQGRSVAKSKRPKPLSEEVGAGREHEGFYKLYSKYVHPTAWLLYGPRDRVHDREVRNIFLIKAQVYAVEIGRMVSTATGVDAGGWTRGREEVAPKEVAQHPATPKGAGPQ